MHKYKFNIFTTLIGFVLGTIFMYCLQLSKTSQTYEKSYYEISEQDYFESENFSELKYPKSIILNGSDIYELCSSIINDAYECDTLPEKYEKNISQEQFNLLNPRKYCDADTSLILKSQEFYTFYVTSVKYNEEQNKAIVEYVYNYYIINNATKHNDFYISSVTNDAPNRIYLSFDGDYWEIEKVKRAV